MLPDAPYQGAASSGVRTRRTTTWPEAANSTNSRSGCLLLAAGERDYSSYFARRGSSTSQGPAGDGYQPGIADSLERELPHLAEALGAQLGPSLWPQVLVYLGELAVEQRLRHFHGSLLPLRPGLLRDLLWPGMAGIAAID